MKLIGRFWWDFVNALFGMLLGGGLGFLGCSMIYGGDPRDPVVGVLLPFTAACSAGVGGIIGANVRTWYRALRPRSPDQL